MLTALLLLFTAIWFSACRCNDEGSDYNWGYQTDNGPSNWPGICRTGQRQSPISINQSMTDPLDCEELNFTNYGSSGSIELYNSGRSLVVIGFSSWTLPPMISGGGLNGSYDLVQFHFHWSNTDQSSADHVVGSQLNPLELHLVHLKRGLNITEAVQLSDGIAVIEVLFQVDPSAESPLKSMQNAINATRRRNGHALFDDFVPERLLPPVRNAFYRYPGSLTTYPCTEVVVWTVLSQPLPVTHELVELFRQFEDSRGDRLLYNSRPPQPLNDRRVLLRQPKRNTALSVVCNNFIILIQLLTLMFWSS